MGPEDLLKLEADPLPNLPMAAYADENQAVLDSLEPSAAQFKAQQASKLATSDDRKCDDLNDWNRDMMLWQKLRIRASQLKEKSSISSDDDILIDDSDDIAAAGTSLGDDE